jgi:membrane associated rhomboid family serine protease
MRPASVGFQCPDDVKLARVGERTPRTVVGAPARALAPYATWTLIGLNVLVYVLAAESSVDGFNSPRASTLFNRWVLVPYQVATQHQFYRLLTSAFLHENVVHIASNMFVLAVLGPYLERLIGWWRYTALYLLAALGGSTAVYLLDSKYISVVGASGAIFGLFAGCLMFVRELGINPRWLVGTIAINVVLTASAPDISVLSHVGGFVMGLLVASAYAGLPWRRHRLPVRMQLTGLAALLAAVIALSAWRTAAI